MFASAKAMNANFVHLQVLQNDSNQVDFVRIQQPADTNARREMVFAIGIAGELKLPQCILAHTLSSHPSLTYLQLGFVVLMTNDHHTRHIVDNGVQIA